eukprot:TRINITY_DN6498_c0_g1_i1.p2 TRINITY_DN6498_c0_g1~~TRINITY_DN6498_c0_g1_i1.p2  ORF type:complete len:107 (-),score=19.13 TRINITY_DN6498_c0_g1_i1:87-407(-)
MKTGQITILKAKKNQRTKSCEFKQKLRLANILVIMSKKLNIVKRMIGYQPEGTLYVDLIRTTKLGYVDNKKKKERLTKRKYLQISLNVEKYSVRFFFLFVVSVLPS